MRVEKARSLPYAPGVYIMRDKRDTIMYVGKAVNLHSRVRSYFRENIDVVNVPQGTVKEQALSARNYALHLAAQGTGPVSRKLTPTYNIGVVAVVNQNYAFLALSYNSRVRCGKIFQRIK